MKQLTKLIPALLISISLCIPAAFAIFYYTQPMEDVSYDLSVLPDDGQEWAGNHGWTFFTDESGNVTELTPDGSGGYLGSSYAGQTFYYSRILTEKLDSPTLQIGVVNRTVSVFLDGEMIYTDCPDLDNRIGYLTLPMLEYDREDPVTVSLPPDCLGKTLTIAQSGGSLSEKQEDTVTVYPCDITLSCGYSYESGLIASTTKTILPAVLMFALELFLLAAFLWNAAAGIFSPGLPVFALAVFFQMCSILSQADFFYQYFGAPAIDPIWLCFHLSVAVLLLFLTFYAKGLRPLYATVSAIQWLGTILYLIIMPSSIFPEHGSQYIFFMNLPQITGFLALSTVLIGSFFLWKKGNRFFRHLAQTALVLTACYVLFLAASIPLLPEYAVGTFSKIKGDARILLPNFSLKLIWNLCLISSIAAAVMELVERETQRRTEAAVLRMKNELAVESYENLCRQSEEVRMMRHDTVKHYSFLRSMAKETPEQVANYLDDLIGQAENVRPVVSSRNQTLNILLNGKLNTASSKNISVEIVRSDAPEKLPLTDTELCCLVMNILDNAINAASRTGHGNAYIELDFHCKDQLFVFTCKNSMPDSSGNKKTPTPGHGYGLKIIRQIMSRWGDNMLSLNQSGTTYTVTFVLPI